MDDSVEVVANKCVDPGTMVNTQIKRKHEDR